MPSVHSAQPSTLTASLAEQSTLSDPASEMLALYRQGKYEEILHRTSAALRNMPGHAELWHIGAGAAYALGLLEDAERFWTVVVTQNPNHAEAHYDLGVLYLDRGQTDAAVRHLSRALSLAPDYPNAMNALGALNLREGRLEEARALFDKAIRRDPRFAQAHVNRAKVCLLEGNQGGAEQGIAAAIAIDPGNGKAHMLRAEQDMTRISAKWVKQLRSAYRSRHSRPVAEQIYLCFAMAKLAERLEETDLAFEAYSEGNRLHYARHPWDERGAERLLAEAITSVGPGIYDEASRIDSGSPGEDRVPIFIVGMPRSGTTLLEQILASHPQAHGCGELPTLTRLLRSAPVPPPSEGERTSWAARLRSVGEAYLETVWTPEVRTRFAVDKMPGNYEVAGWIPLAMPQAKIIHIRRNPLDTCFSCFATLFSDGHEYTFDQAVLARQYDRYRRWMAHWRAVMPQGSLLEIDYERLVADLEGVTRSVLAYVGLPWHPDCLRFHRNGRTVLTASRAQVRKPLYTSSIGRWRRFERHLMPLRTALAPYLSENVS